MRRGITIVKRTFVAMWDDQATHHAAALTYYSLMCFFPLALLAVALLGLLGQFPATYEAIVSYFEGVVPPEVLAPLDDSLRQALQARGAAFAGLIVAIAVALYGTTGALEAARRALNVVFEVEGSRGFVMRKAIDVVSTVVLLLLIVASLLMVFIGGGLAEDLFDFLGLGDTAVSIWGVLRWPGAFLAAVLVYSLVYYVTPDVRQRSFRWITPGAAIAVSLWLAASLGFSAYLGEVANVGAIYGTFAGAIVLVGWLFLTNLSLIFGAELNAEIERQKELAEGVPLAETLNRPPRGS